MSKIQVIPTIIEGTVEAVSGKLSRIEGLVKRVQIDVVDGLFADNLTVTPRDLKEVDFDELKIDVHLMVEDPTEWISECLMIKPDRVIGQVERMGSQWGFVEGLEENEVKAGLALNIHTPLESLETELLERVAVVLLMGYEAGEGGQALNEKVFNKIEELRERYEGLIQVDGGVKADNVRKLIAFGVDEVAVGTFLWSGDVEQRLKEIANEA